MGQTHGTVGANQRCAAGPQVENVGESQCKSWAQKMRPIRRAGGGCYPRKLV